MIGGGMHLELTVGDLTTAQADAIVNAAAPALLGGGGVDGAIHRAGGPAILAACRELRSTARYRDGLARGDAVATTAGNLAARWVIHTVGPVYRRPGVDRSVLLRSCYTRSLVVADELGAASVAFPLISAGAYGWPVRDALAQAFAALRAADTRVETVTLWLFAPATGELARELLAGS